MLFAAHKGTNNTNNKLAKGGEPIVKRKENKPEYPVDKIARITWKIQQITAGNASKTDPNGSYTGLPLFPNEVPVQDADDL